MAPPPPERDWVILFCFAVDIPGGGEKVGGGRGAGVAYG